jgi:murein DD-endopeptidase MepM/ murein hydrolase activator NlpD
MNKSTLVLASIIFIALAFLSGIYLERKGEISTLSKAVKEESNIKDNFKYGINLASFDVSYHKVEKNEAFSDILEKINIEKSKVQEILNSPKELFNTNKIKAGNNYTVLGQKEGNSYTAQKLIYEENKIDFIIINLEDSVFVERGQNDINFEEREVGGIVRNSLYKSFSILDIHPSMAVKLAEIFSCTVDFYKIKEGDKFKLVFEDAYLDGKPLGTGKIKAALFESGGKEYQAYYFEKYNIHAGEYFDESGSSMKKQFLKAPVKFGRISSKFSNKRLHPVTRVVKAHLGTDYAAPHGTPIIATADGVIEEAKFKIYNGNYVKIRHNGQFKTQYLHMSRIAAGMKPGRKVRQGDIIGYVGSTGLATGPHVCYRFWKEGKQVDPFKQSLKFSEMLSGTDRNNFLKNTASLKKSIQNLSFDADPKQVLKEKHQAKIKEKAFDFVSTYF